MIGLARQLFGLMVVAALAALFYTGATSASRSRLNVAIAEAEKVTKDESALLGRLEEYTSNQTTAVALPTELLWQGEDPATLEIAIQQQILNAAEIGGMQVIAFGAAAPPDGITQPTIGYEVELEGGHAEVAQFLSLLEEVRPGLAIGTLWMRQLPPADGVSKAPVSLRMTAWGFRNAVAGTP
jgi:hypothetical protein